MSPETVQRISQQQLESYLWGAATLLRGTIDAGDYKQFIFPLLFYKRLCDVFDEERAQAMEDHGQDFPEDHRFNIPDEAHWGKTREVTQNVGQSIQRAMRAIEKANQDKLYGIFGDAQWTNKDRLSDAMLRDLIEHFSTLDLTIANLPEDELGNGYEYLIKKFADDSGHTAAEFYTNRTVVHLMTELLQPQPGESIYDPTCGSGGMLLSAIAHLRNQGKEWRNVKLYGQELNLMTSSIARMNCFLHGIEDFRIERGNTLSNPKLIEGGELQKFDVILANPPYSIKQWDRAAFENDPWGRNMWGTPPQGRADYAFQQHIIKSLSSKGRCAVLWPLGVLFRGEERDLRAGMLRDDVVDYVIALGPGLFYNSPMEACIVICNRAKPPNRKGKVTLVDARGAIDKVGSTPFLSDQNIRDIVEVVRNPSSMSLRACEVTLESLEAVDWDLSVTRHVAVAKNEPSSRAEELFQSAVHLAGAALESLGRELPQQVRWERQSFTPGSGQFPAPVAAEPYSFDAIAENRTKRTDPAKAPGSIYVGLEHIEPQNLHIASHGTSADVKGTKLFFERGDVIFGRRRAYQRKVALAKNEGICSAHAMVLRGRSGVVSPSFFPWFVSSNQFLERAIAISVGSLSPTVNWKALRAEMFNLLSLKDQEEIAAVAWASDALEHRLRALAQSLRKYRLAYGNLKFESYLSDPETEVRRLAEILESKLCNGIFVRKADFGQGVLLVNVADIYKSFNVDLDSLERVPADERQQGSFSARPGDVIFNRSSLVKAGVGHACHVPESDEPLVFECHLIRARPDHSRVDSRFLARYSLSRPGRRFIVSRGQTTTMTTINQTDLSELPVPTPPIQEQKLLADQLDTLEQIEQSLVRAAESICQAKLAAVNQASSAGPTPQAKEVAHVS